jgi:hypothetical protein
VIATTNGASKVLIATLIIGLLMIPHLVHAEVYKWMDEKGDIHFTDDYSTIPEKYKQQLERRSLSEDSKSMMEGTQKEKRHAKPAEEKKTEVKKGEIPLNIPVVQKVPSIFSGQIIKIDNVERMLTIKGKEETVEFTVSENTKIATDLGNTVLFTELWRGMLVTVEYLKKGSAIYPVKIRINTVELYRGRR